MSKSNKASDFLENMKLGDRAEPPLPKPKAVPAIEEEKAIPKAKAPTRAGLKHIGGYLEPETVEKVVLLRARLKMDNSELMAYAIDELWNKQKAKKAFSD